MTCEQRGTPGEAQECADRRLHARCMADARQACEALEAVADPERAARAKMAKSRKRAEARKRRVGEFRAGKGSGESAKKRARDV